MLGFLWRSIAAIVRLVAAILLFSLLFSALLWGVGAFGLVDGPIGSLADGPGVTGVDGPGASGVDGPGASDSDGWTDGTGGPGEQYGATDDRSAGENGSETTASEAAAIEAAVHRRVNEVRAEHDRSRLRHDAVVANVSREHSEDMHERDYFSHVSPDGETPADRMSEHHPRPCRGVGENLALVQGGGDTPEEAARTADRAVDGWLRSEGHRENLLREGWDSEGIGVSVTDDGRVYVTQTFCQT